METDAAVPPQQPWGDTSLQHLRCALQEFAAERDWQQYHTPRNLLLALVRLLSPTCLVRPNAAAAACSRPAQPLRTSSQVGEVGELSELFQWRGEVSTGLPGFTPAERRHVGESHPAAAVSLSVPSPCQCHCPLPVPLTGSKSCATAALRHFIAPTPRVKPWPALSAAGEELSDVLLYLVRLADACHVDLAEAVLRKLTKNADKYPAHRCRGSAAKYTAYAEGPEAAGAAGGSGDDPRDASAPAGCDERRRQEAAAAEPQ